MPKINLFKTPRECMLFILFEKIINEGFPGIEKTVLINELSQRTGLSTVMSEIEILDFLSCHEFGNDENIIPSKFIEIFLSEETGMIWMHKKFRIYLVDRFYKHAGV